MRANLASRTSVSITCHLWIWFFVPLSRDTLVAVKVRGVSVNGLARFRDAAVVRCSLSTVFPSRARLAYWWSGFPNPLVRSFLTRKAGLGAQRAPYKCVNRPRITQCHLADPAGAIRVRNPWPARGRARPPGWQRGSALRSAPPGSLRTSRRFRSSQVAPGGGRFILLPGGAELGHHAVHLDQLIAISLYASRPDSTPSSSRFLRWEERSFVEGGFGSCLSTSRGDSWRRDRADGVPIRSATSPAALQAPRERTRAPAPGFFVPGFVLVPRSSRPAGGKSASRASADFGGRAKAIGRTDREQTVDDRGQAVGEVRPDVRDRDVTPRESA